MLQSFLSEIVVGLFVFAMTALAAYSRSKYKELSKKTYSKLTIFHITRYRSKALGHTPYYTREHQTAEQSGLSLEAEPVFDETVSMTLAVSNFKHVLRPLRCGTDGHADCYRIAPDDDSLWIDHNFNDKKNPSSYLVQMNDPGNVLALSMTRWNGLQDNNAEYGTTAEYAGQHVSLMIDVTHVPNHEKLFRHFAGYYEPSERTTAPVALPRTDLAKGVYRWSYTCAHPGDVIRVKFEIDPTQAALE